MKNPFGLLLVLFICLSVPCQIAWAQTYPALGFPLQLNTPKFNALAADFSTSKGTVALDLRFVYSKGNKFKCVNNSTVDGVAASCKGVQIGEKYNLRIKSLVGKTRISLKGGISSGLVKAGYKGPKGKLNTKKIAVLPQFSTAAVDSTVILKPNMGAKGKFTASSGDINSGYSQMLPDIALSGSVKANKKVTWTLKGAGNKLIFSGKEESGKWIGKLKGNLGPAKFSKLPISIPLVEYNQQARFYGIVSISDGLESPGRAKNAKVLIRSDRNNNGGFENDEIISVDIDNPPDPQNPDNGHFDQMFAVTAGRPVLISFEMAGYSSNHIVFTSLSPGANLPIYTTLRKLDALTPANGQVKSTDSKLHLSGLPNTVVTASGKVFNPFVEGMLIPSEQFDTSGNILSPSVVATIEAKDGSNNPLTELASGTQLRMFIARDAWGTLLDLEAGNNQIDLPVYSYDDILGVWKRSDLDGWLEDEDGAKLPETALTNLKNSSYIGNIYASAPIDHLAHWSVSWPVDTHSCVSGRLMDGSGNPVSGAVLTVNGKTYAGTRTVSTSYTGRFCIDAMRSEAAATDLNHNGISGESQQIQITAFVAGNYYDLGSHTMPTVAPACTTTGCTENCAGLGDIALPSAIEVPAAVCNLKGKVVYSGTSLNGNANLNAGDPIPNLLVEAHDTSAPEDLLDCYFNGSCQVTVSTRSNGEFELDVPIWMGADLLVKSADTFASYFAGSLTTQACPAERLTISLDYFGG